MNKNDHIMLNVEPVRGALLREQARKENISDSKLVRKAVIKYLSSVNMLSTQTLETIWLK